MDLDRHYTDPRLVAKYDVENSGRIDTEFYLRLAGELDVTDVIDLGCGTGVLAVDLAVNGRHVTGVDPAAAMLERARHRPGGDRVTWVLGDAGSMSPETADLVVMTGHVAQVFLSENEWGHALGSGFRALKPGGHLAFETRNPDALEWNRWTRENTMRTYATPGAEPFQSWGEVTGVGPGTVSFAGHNVFPGSGEDLVAASTLRFRTRYEVEASLSAAGFEVEAVFGDWDRSPVTSTSLELIFLARRPLAAT